MFQFTPMRRDCYDYKEMEISGTGETYCQGERGGTYLKFTMTVKLKL